MNLPQLAAADTFGLLVEPVLDQPLCNAFLRRYSIDNATLGHSSSATPFPLAMAAANMDDSLATSTLVDWCPHTLDEQLVAVGHSTGHVSVTGIKSSNLTLEDLLAKREFAPRSSRQCSQVCTCRCRSPPL